MFVDNETFPVDPATGEATVPFAATTQYGKQLVLGTASGFAELATFVHHQEMYNLKAGGAGTPERYRRSVQPLEQPP